MTDRGALQRPLLVVGIEAESRGAGAERGQQEIIGIEAAVAAARFRRLVGREPALADENVLHQGG